MTKKHYGIPLSEVKLILDPDEYQEVDFVGKFDAELVLKAYNTLNQELTLYFDTGVEDYKFKINVHGRKCFSSKNSRMRFRPKENRTVDFGSAELNTHWVITTGIVKGEIRITDGVMYDGGEL